MVGAKRARQTREALDLDPAAPLDCVLTMVEASMADEFHRAVEDLSRLEGAGRSTAARTPDRDVRIGVVADEDSDFQRWAQRWMALAE